MMARTRTPPQWIDLIWNEAQFLETREYEDNPRAEFLLNAIVAAHEECQQAMQQPALPTEAAAVIERAKAMPRSVPQSGGAGDTNTYEITNGAVWMLDEALSKYEDSIR